MRLINGVYVYASWESWIAYFKAKQHDAKQPTGQRLGQLLANEIHVTLAILDDDTLEWDYKLKRLIKPKDFKQAKQLLDMLVAHLQRNSPSSCAIQAACHLRGAWSEMSYAHSVALRDSRPPNEHALRGTKGRILDNVALLLGELRAIDAV
jgi:hypothetical protein